MAEALSFEAVLNAQGFLNGINQMLAGLSNLKAQTAAATSGITGQLANLKSGLMSALSGGDFSKAGEQLGQAIVGPLSSSFGALGGAAANVATALGPVGVAALGVGAAMVGLGAGIASAVGKATEFERAISEVAAKAGIGANELFELDGKMTSFAEVARQAGATSIYSASESATALRELVAGGMNAQQASSALMGTLQLAATENMEFSRAAEITVNTLSQFKMGAEEADRVANVLAATAAKSTSSVQDLGYALTYVGPVAGALGMDLEETSAALGVLANAGFKGTMGGTALRGILSDLINPTKKTQEIIEGLGLSMEDVDPRMHSLADILDTLKSHGMTAADVMAIFGERGGPGMLALLAQGSDALRQFEQDITGTNAAAEMSATTIGNLWGAKKMLASAVEEAQIALGNLFLPALTSITQGATQLVIVLTNVGKTIYDVVANSQAAQAIGSMFSAIGGAVQSALGNIGNLLKPAFDAIGGGAGVVNALKTAFNALTAPITAVATVIKTVAQGFQQFSSALSPITSQIGSALGNAVTQLVDKFERAKATVQAFIQVVSQSSTFQSAFSFLQTHAQNLQEAFERLRSIVQGLWEGVKERVSDAVGGALEYVQSKIDDFVDWLKSTPIGQLLFGAGEAAGGLVENVKNALISPFEGFINEVRTKAEEIYNASKTPGEKAAEGVSDGIKENKDLVKDAVVDSVAGSDVISEAGEAAKDAGRKISKEFVSGYEAGLSDMQIVSMINAMTAEASSAWERWKGSTAAQEKNLQLSFAWSADKFGQQYKLYVDGQLMGSVSGAYSKEDALRMLLDQAGITTSEPTVLRLLGRPGEAALLEMPVEVVSDWDLRGSERNWAKFVMQNKPLVDNAGEELARELYEAMGRVTKWEGSDYGATLQESLNYVIQAVTSPGSVTEEVLNTALADLVRARVIAPRWADEIRAAASGAMDKLEDVIVDRGKYLETLMKQIGEDAGNALADGMISVQEQEALLKLVELYEKAGGDMGDALIQAIVNRDWSKVSEIIASQMAGAGDIIVDRAKYLETLLQQIGETAGNALADGLLTAQERETLTALVDAYMKAGGDASNALIQAVLNQDWEGLGRAIGGRTGASFKSELFGEIQGALAPTLEQILKDPKLAESIMYPSLFIKNTFQPALKRDFEQMNSLYKTGLAENIQVVKNWADSLVGVYQQHADWFKGWQGYILDLYRTGQISLVQMMEMWAYAEGMLEKASTATKNASVGYDQLSKSIKECSECMSDFGTWQEEHADELFMGSYIGPGGESYLAWKTEQLRRIRETQLTMQKVGGVSVGKQYTGPEWEWVETPELKAKLTIDNTEANAAIQSAQDLYNKLKSDVSSPENKLHLDTTGAMAALQTLLSTIEANRYQTIYVETVHYDTYAGANGSVSAASAASAAAGALWSRITGYQSGTDFVPETGLYLLHRGEAVIPAEENRSRSSSATFIFNTYISGEVGDPEAWRKELDRRDEILRREFRAADMKLARAR
jgi:TP901 family phage tail tape measure protein